MTLRFETILGLNWLMESFFQIGLIDITYCQIHI